MSLFGSAEKARKGVIIDIGSGSVGIAIVYSDPNAKEPELLWSTREHMRVSESADLTDIQKRLQSTVMNAFLALGNTGIPTVQASDKAGPISTAQVAICAPWSYTIAKVVNFEDGAVSTLTDSLMAQLVGIAKEKVTEEIQGNNTITTLNLEIIAQEIIEVLANGYPVTEATGQTVTSINLAHVSVLSQKHLLDQIRDAHSRIIPATALRTHSFMLLFYASMRQFAPDMLEFCLVDITREATEMGIVRDGVLRYVTHTPFGSNTLLRGVAAALNTTKEEAYSYLKDENAYLQGTLTVPKQTELQAIFADYERKITDLFGRTGDALSIPRTIFMHTERRTSDFFAHHLSTAAKAATDLNHQIYDSNATLFADVPAVEDTAILLSARFFHTDGRIAMFE